MSKSQLVRISASMSAEVLNQLDGLVKQRGFGNRSALLTEMIQKETATQNRKHTNQVMAGTVTLFYDHSVMGLRHRLSELKHKYLAEIISSTQIQLEGQHTLEVNLLQGPAQRLQLICDEMVANKGVKTGKLYLVNSALPPIHQKNDQLNNFINDEQGAMDQDTASEQASKEG